MGVHVPNFIKGNGLLNNAIHSNISKYLLKRFKKQTGKLRTYLELRWESSLLLWRLELSVFVPVAFFFRFSLSFRLVS